MNKDQVCVHTQFLKEEQAVLAYNRCTINGDYDFQHILTQYFVSDPILGLGNTVEQNMARETNSK